MRFSFFKPKSYMQDGRSYVVKVPDEEDLNRTWSTREAARAYKRLLLAEKRLDVLPEIWEYIFDKGFELEGRKIS